MARSGSAAKNWLRWLRLWVIGYAAATVISTPLPLHATQPPAPGKSFPAEYLKYRDEHPEQFRLRGGLAGKAARARAAQRNAARGTAAGAGVSLLAASGAVSGSVEIPVVLVEYANRAQPYGSATLQETLFDGPNATGTLTEYYDEVSYGNLDVSGTVFDWVELPSDDTVYEGTTSGLTPGMAETGQLIEDALDLVDPGVDFGAYDNDGPDGVPNSGDDDGLVDFIAFVHPETGGECGNSNVWSHRWVYRAWPNAGGQRYTTDDARSGGGSILIDDYVIQPALNCAGGNIEIGVFAHEFGHAFGIPDLYDTESPADSQGIGHWSLMAAGNWRTPAEPAHWDPWSKSRVGWLVPTLLTSETLGLAIPEAENNATAFQITIGNGQYFLVENRQAVGFDAQIAQCGLLIWHVDESVSSGNRVQNCGTFQQNPPSHYLIALEQADAACHLEANVNRSDAGDPFPGSTTNRDFSATTNPSSEDYAGNDLGVSVTNISDCAASMTADVQAFPLPRTTPGPVDVVFLIDNTGSYLDDLPIIQGQIQDITDLLSAEFSDIRFGLASFRDFPFGSFGEPGDFAYRLDLPLTTNAADFVSAVQALSADGGDDGPESQYEALFQLLTGSGRDLTGDGDTGDTGEIAPSNVGFQAGRARVVYLLTDASFHDADTESYPGTTLEAAGRTAVRALLSPGDPFLFTLIAENPGVVVTSGESTQVPPIVSSELQTQATELADRTGGGVGFAGSNSADLAVAIDETLPVLVDALPFILQLDVDIRPGEGPNPINLTNGGVIPVAILGSAAFDVSEIDVTTLAFGPAGASPAHKNGGSLEDVNGDGFDDLLSHYRTRQTGIGPDTTEACVTGETSSGQPFEGCDELRVVPACGQGFELILVIPALMGLWRRRGRLLA